MEYEFKLTQDFLTIEERAVFSKFLKHHNLEENIWPVFESLFRSKIRGTDPCILKVFRKSELQAAVIIISCSKYGRALFKNPLLTRLIDSLGLSFYLWIKFGCCMDMMSNPGFVREPCEADIIYKEVARYLANRNLLTVIYDYDENTTLFERSAILPSLPHALINTSGMNSSEAYLKDHKNLKKKLRVFQNKGGTFEIVSGSLSPSDVRSLKKCFVSTAEKSVFYLPYQDLYLSAAQKTSSSNLPGTYYFVARVNDEFLGYQAAVKSGRYLNALHGAFDRTRKSTFHAYDILFYKMTEFAIENNLDLIDFGAVLNITKQRMVNETRNMSYYLYSKYPYAQKMISRIMKSSRLQAKEQLKFRTS